MQIKRISQWRTERVFRLAGTTLAIATLASCSSMNDEAARAAIKAADIVEINNVMSLHSWYHAAMQNSVEVEKIWSKRDDIIIARNSGYWKGDNVRKYYGEKVGEPFTTGAFVWHPVTTGVIEVAEDRQTAKGVWYTIGGGGHANADDSKSFDWMWEKYGVDFVLEDGKWKVWHMKVYTDWTGGSNISFQKGGSSTPAPDATGMSGAPSGTPPGDAPPSGTPPQKSEAASKDAEASVLGNAPPEGGAQMPASLTAAEDVVYQNPYKVWSGTAAPKMQPRPPEPYRTFSETWSYADETE